MLPKNSLISCGSFMIFCGVLITVLRCEEQYVIVTLENFEFVADPKYASFNSTIGTALIDGAKTTIFNFVGDLYLDVPCETSIVTSFTGRMKDVYADEPFMRQTLKLGSFLDGYQNLTLGGWVQHVRNCTTPYIVCPMKKGLHIGSNCTVLATKMNAPFMSKSWNVSFTVLLQDTVPIFSFWFTLEFDDTRLLRAKRPSAVQQRARRQKGKKP